MMKKILIILSSLVAVSGSMPGLANFNTNNIKFNEVNSLKSGFKKIINVNPIAQKGRHYCVAASIQIILQNFHVPINMYTQEVIYQNLGGYEDSGLHINRVTANYLNSIRENSGDTRGIQYSYEGLPTGYGSDPHSLIDFQDLVVQSISSGAPLLFGHVQQNEEALLGHAVVINGIEVDENDPLNTTYHYIETTGGYQTQFRGCDLINLLQFGGGIIGASNNFDLADNKVNCSAKDVNFMNNEANNWVWGEIPINLSSVAGVMDLKQLQQFTWLRLPDSQLNISWGSHHAHHAADGWLTSNFKDGNLPWRQEYSETWTDGGESLTYEWKSSSKIYYDTSSNSMLLYLQYGIDFILTSSVSNNKNLTTNNQISSNFESGSRFSLTFN